MTIRIPSDWRRRLPLAIASLLFAAGNLVFFTSFRTSTHERRQALETRRDELKSAVEGREAEAARLSGQRERLSGASEAMEEFYGRRIGTLRQTLDDVVADLHADLKEAGVETNNISYASSALRDLPVTEMKINFAIRTDYPRFKKLLRIFETGKRWIAVQSVSIHRESDQPGTVGVQMDLVTYFSNREEGPAGSETARPSAPATAHGRGAVPARSSR